jgi:glycine/D-amino acid oxidase-like deaminating enzyme
MRAAVVGAGIVGLATAYELSRRGAAVTVYERGAPGAGQSGGESRIFRHAHDDPRLVALAVESRARWRAWEERLGIELVAPVGSVALGPAVERRLSLLLAAGVRARMTDAATALPILAPGPVLLDEDGGVIRTTAAIRALVAALGDALVADEVIELAPSGEVRAGGAIEVYERVIVCAGRDTAILAAGVGLELPVRVSTHTRYAYPVRHPARLACLQDGTAGAYGDPLPGDDRYAIGLGDTDPTDYVAERLPGLEPRPVETRTCWVTELPWAHDGMAVWEAGALRFVAGNNLFKHAPALGWRLAADELDELRPERQLGTAAG